MNRCRIQNLNIFRLIKINDQGTNMGLNSFSSKKIDNLNDMFKNSK